jgi:hypothetical protein
MLKKFCQCLGLASILFVANYGDLLGGGSDARMHVPFPLTGIIDAQLADILLLGLLFFAILVPISRTRAYPRACLIFSIVIPPWILLRTRYILPVHLYGNILALVAILWAGIVLLLFLKLHHLYRSLLRLGDFAGIVLAIFAACSITQLLYIRHWTPGPRHHSSTWATSPQPPRQHPLLVWVVFDELSFDQLFDHRAANLALPNFDALRSQSTLFTDTQPIGFHTVDVIPSLLTGHIVDSLSFTLDNHVRLHNIGIPGRHPLDPSQTVFADAQQQGWRTAAVGWYNPYCTLYNGNPGSTTPGTSTIDDCYWSNLDKFDGPMSQQATLVQNILSPLRQAAVELVNPTRAARDLCAFDVHQRTLTYIDLEQHTDRLLHTGQADFVFLHLPIPHSPNIWSRAANAYTRQCGASYLDSLALADRELGRVLTTLQASPRWKDTTLIVQGDHSWRTILWNNQPAWTSEDQAASRSTFDPRPAVIIHQTGQTQPRTIAQPWSLLNVHTIVEQVLHGQSIRF